MPLRRTRRALIVLLLIISLMTWAVPGASAATTDASAEAEFVKLINQDRKARGLGPLRLNLQLTRVARDWSGSMAAAGRISHRPRLANAVDGNWTRLAENVGVGPSVSTLHSTFMNSSGHRANVLGDFNHVGVGVVRSGGRMWVTVNFLKGSGDYPAFTDVKRGTHRPNVEAVFRRGTTNGCSSKRYCPGSTVTRAQMASFLARELGLSPGSVRQFRDVSSSHTHAGAIGAVAARGITIGCSKDRFCPNEPVTRGQMATFLQRALDLKGAEPSRFKDVGPSHAHRAGIGAMERAGITKGCETDRFCPGARVRRDQMASFLERAFG
jgi:hypothetical protein